MRSGRSVLMIGLLVLLGAAFIVVLFVFAANTKPPTTTGAEATPPEKVYVADPLAVTTLGGDTNYAPSMWRYIDPQLHRICYAIYEGGVHCEQMTAEDRAILGLDE